MRIILVLVFLSILNSFVYSQDWNSLYNSALADFNAKKYTEAIRSLESAQHVAEAQFGRTHSKYRSTLELLAKSYDATDQYAKSIVLYKGLRDILKNENKATSLDYSQVQMSLGMAYSKLFERSLKSKDVNDYQKEEFYRSALEALKSSYGISKDNSKQKTVEFVTVLKTMAKLSSYKKSEAKNAESYYSELLTTVSSFQGNKSELYLSSLYDYADFTADRKQYAQAYKLFDEHISTSEALKKPKKDILESYFRRAFCAYKLNEKATALKCYSDLLLTYESVHGLKGKDFPSVIDQSVKNLEVLGFKAELEKFFLKKMESIKAQFGEQSVQYGNELEDFGNFKAELSQFDKAKEYVEKGIAIFKAQKGEKSVEYLNGNDNLGRLYEKMGQFDKAESIFLSTQDLRKKHLGETSNEYTFGMDSLGRFYLRREKYVEADTLFSRSLRTRAVQPGKKHAYYGISLGNKAELFLTQNQYAEAEKLLKQQYEVYKQHYGEISFESGLVLFKLGEVALQLKKPDEAMKIFKDCTSLFQSVTNEKADFFVDKSQKRFSTAQLLKSEMNKK
jgi:hypothetical protein